MKAELWDEGPTHLHTEIGLPQDTYLSPFQKEQFILRLRSIIVSCFANSFEKGFWEGQQNKSEKLMLIVTELGECCEAIRKGAPAEHIKGGFTGEEEELADACIRIFDYCGAHGLKLAEAILAKMDYNLTRPHKHGKAF